MRTLASLISLTLLAPAAIAAPAPSGTSPAAADSSHAAAAPTAAPSAPQLEPIDLASVTDACKPLAKQALPNPPAAQPAPPPVAAAASQSGAPSQSTARPNPQPPVAQPPVLTPAARSAALAARVALASCMVQQAIAPLQLCDCGDSIVAVDAAAAPGIAILDGVIAAGDPANQLLAEHTEGQLYDSFAAHLQAALPKLGPDATDAETALRDMRKQTLEAQLGPWHEAAMTAFQHVVELAKAHPELQTNPTIMTAVRDSEQRLAADVATAEPQNG